MWQFSTNKKDGLTCPDGTTAPIQETYKFDDLTMTGTRSVIHNDVCDGLPASITKLPVHARVQQTAADTGGPIPALL